MGTLAYRLTGKLRHCLPLFVLFFFLFSQTAIAASLMDVYQLAQSNDPSFQAAHFQKLAINEGRKQAIARMLPTVAGSAEYTQTTQDIKSSDNTVFGAGKTDFDTTSYSLTLTQPIFHWDLIAGHQQSKAENLRAEAEYTMAVQDLMVQVADLYLQALSAQDQLVFVRSEETAVAKHFELASGRHEMGLIPVTDLHDAKARLATTQAKTIAAQNLLDDALQALQEVAGEPVESLSKLQAEIFLQSPDPIDVGSWIQGALKQNPSIEVQKHAVTVARKEVSRQRSGHYPNLDLIGRYNSQETEGTLFGGGSEIDTTDILLQLNVPIFQGGYVNSRVREAKHQLSIARQELIKQERAIERQTRSAYLGVNSAIRQVEAFSQSMVSSQLALEAKQEGFLSGLFTSLAVLDAERDLFLVKQDYAQARYDYLLNSLKLKYATGSLSEMDLTQLDQWFRKGESPSAQIKAK
ncbi:MAG: TolC family outer membrane protein [Desulfuromonadales bacterium]|nr:TolC family outer membrane protein [Desulfuromonadales bacterium]